MKSTTNDRRPILVTGCPRSGTTWVGKTIGASPDVFYVYEPFNDDAPVHLDVDRRFLELGPRSQPPITRDIAELVRLGRLDARLMMSLTGLAEHWSAHRRIAPRLAANQLVRRPGSFVTPTRICIKDPLAFYAAEWFADTHDAHVVVLVRHPAGVVSSYLALRWESELDAIIDRPLPAGRLSLQAEVDAYRRTGQGGLDALILQWKIFTAQTLDMVARRPDFSFIIHDELCRQPDAYYRDLFAHLGLDYSDDIRKRVMSESSAENVTDPVHHQQHQHARDSRQLVGAWRTRLDPHVSDRILAETSDLWAEVCDAVVPLARQRRAHAPAPGLGATA